MSNIKISVVADPIHRQKLDRMLVVLRASMHGDEQLLARFLLETESKSHDRAKRQLARELIDHCFGVHS